MTSKAALTKALLIPAVLWVALFILHVQNGVDANDLDLLVGIGWFLLGWGGHAIYLRDSLRCSGCGQRMPPGEVDAVLRHFETDCIGEPAQNYRKFLRAAKAVE